jgi:hypothetical protein
MTKTKELEPVTIDTLKGIDKTDKVKILETRAKWLQQQREQDKNILKNQLIKIKMLNPKYKEYRYKLNYEWREKQLLNGKCAHCNKKIFKWNLCKKHYKYHQEYGKKHYEKQKIRR